MGDIHVVGTSQTDRRQDHLVGPHLDGHADCGISKRGKIHRILNFCRLSSILMILLGILSISGIFIYDHHPGGVADINTLTSPSNMGALTLPTNSTYSFPIPNSERYNYINYSLDLTADDNSKGIRVDFTLCDPNSNYKEPVGQYFRQMPSDPYYYPCELEENKMDISNRKDCFIIRYWPEVNLDHISGNVSCWTTEHDTGNHKVYMVWDSLLLDETNINKLYDLINCTDAIDNDGKRYPCSKAESPLDINSSIFRQGKQDKNVFVMRFCLGKGADVATTNFTVDFHEYFYNYFTEPGINLYSIDTNEGKTSVLVPLISDEGAPPGDDIINVCIKVSSSEYATQPVVINRYGIPSMQYVKQTVLDKEIISVFDGAVAILVGTVILLCFIYLLPVCKYVLQKMTM